MRSWGGELLRNLQGQLPPLVSLWCYNNQATQVGCAGPEDT